MRSPRALIGLSLVLVILAGRAPAALAQELDPATRAAAVALAEEGDALFDQGKYEAALDRFNRAEALAPVPTLGLRAARSLAKLGRLVEASERYVAVSKMPLPVGAPEVHAQAKEDAEREHRALQMRFPRVVVRVEGGGAGLHVTIDGKPMESSLLGVEQRLAPGGHVFVAEDTGRTVRQEIDMPEGSASEVRLQFPGPPAPDVPQRDTTGMHPVSIAGFVGIGLGGAGLIVGAVLAGVTAGQRSDLEASCGEVLQCPPALHGDADSYNGMRVGTTVSLVAGGVIAAAGVILVLVAPSSDASSSAALRFDPTGIRVLGTF